MKRIRMISLLLILILVLIACGQTTEDKMTEENYLDHSIDYLNLNREDIISYDVDIGGEFDGVLVTIENSEGEYVLRMDYNLENTEIVEESKY